MKTQKLGMQRVQRKNDKRKESNWKSKGFTLTISQYNALLVDQNYCCAICQRHEDEFKRGLCVDHDHVSKEVRGLLCINCNALIGHAKDNIWVLEKAVKYLSRQVCLDTLEREIGC